MQLNWQQRLTCATREHGMCCVGFASLSGSAMNSTCSNGEVDVDDMFVGGVSPQTTGTLNPEDPLPHSCESR